MDVSLLKERFKAIKQETVDVAVSSINAYRAFIGNGVAVGKLAEPIFAKLLDAPNEGFFAFHFAFALLKTSVTALVRLTAEGVSQHFERGFGQQLARFA